MKKIVAILLVLCAAAVFAVLLQFQETTSSIGSFAQNQLKKDKNVSPTIFPTPTIPSSKILPNDYHIFQTFNNCGPAALSMALSYYDINVSQQELGDDIRPNQHPKGISDDKSVTLDELVIKAREYNLTPYHRPNGSIEIIKGFIANGIPVIARTWLKPGEDIGHYRVVKGYDDSTQSLLQDDSLQGKNIWYTYDSFNALWEAFNFEYVVLIPQEKTALAKQILGEDFEEIKSWEKAGKISADAFEKDSSNTYAGFNTAVAYSRIGEHKKATEWFEKIENKLPRRMLWYQIDPIMSYVSLGNYSRAKNLINTILATENNAHAELFLIKSYIYKQENSLQESKYSYQLALQFNTNILKYQTIFPSNVLEEIRQL